ncbi:MAG: ZIP family metal transporter [Acholeplasmatales bacterium]|jgi:ZIP family zinc transporter|nr:ZIP family metal transporter [Acholeplasmataceae bacterium]MDY0115085.1 ZIP family metal transporter [Acholeplasmatales bacterium]MCK9233908.1 ZIP family metal transporter [Acholeplasmataceae bacterium]MCK9289163.1 ZIP family metal transporter [Acholeplasmataceae bacterium]MCK9427073.1 ZIP family metal transporter [Acholeplasmataceae bacterium]
MIAWLLSLPIWLVALLGGLFTWFVTLLGAALVFFFKTINNKMYALILGFASGIMVAASIWSLIIPALEYAEELGYLPWLVAAVGIFLGVLFLFLFDKILPHVHFGENQPEGIKTSWSRTRLLIFSITLHNIPEGLAVGVAVGAVGAVIKVGGDATAAMVAALAVIIGIAIQDFPEGAAVSIPLRQEGLSRRRAFNFGQLSAIVEPVFAVIGALLVSFTEKILPFALAFSAGAMIFVVVEELVPEARQRSSVSGAHYSTWGFTIGFIIMMILDVALG